MAKLGENTGKIQMSFRVYSQAKETQTEKFHTFIERVKSCKLCVIHYFNKALGNDVSKFPQAYLTRPWYCDLDSESQHFAFLFILTANKVFLVQLNVYELFGKNCQLL